MVEPTKGVHAMQSPTPNDTEPNPFVSVYPACPFCRTSYAGHVFCLFASVVLSKDNLRLGEEFDKAIQQRRWPALAVFKEWRGGEDNLEGYLLKCPSGTCGVVVLHDPYVPYGQKFPYRAETLTPYESTELESVLGSSRCIQL